MAQLIHMMEYYTAINLGGLEFLMPRIMQIK